MLSVTDKDKMPFIASYAHSFYSRNGNPPPNYDGSSGNTMFGFYADTDMTDAYTWGHQYGKYAGPDSQGDYHNPDPGDINIFPTSGTNIFYQHYSSVSTSTYSYPEKKLLGNSNQTTQKKMPQIGNDYAVRFRSANNGLSSTVQGYPSPNRLFCNFAYDHDSQSTPSGGVLGDEWTIEMWIYPAYPHHIETNAQSKQCLFDSRSVGNTGVENPVIFLYRNGNNNEGYVTIGSGNNNLHATPSSLSDQIRSSNGSITFNEYTEDSAATGNEAWQHLAVVKRAGDGANNIGIFIDGVEMGGGQANSSVNSGVYQPNFTSFYLGDDADVGPVHNDGYPIGYAGGISNVRVSQGTLYNSNFSSSLPDLYYG